MTIDTVPKDMSKPQEPAPHPISSLNHWNSLVDRVQCLSASASVPLGIMSTTTALPRLYAQQTRFIVGQRFGVYLSDWVFSLGMEVEVHCLTVSSGESGLVHSSSIARLGKYP